MDSDTIISILAGAITEVLEELLEENPVISASMDEENSFKGSGYAAVVGLMGQMNGRIVLDVPVEAALGVSKKILFDEDISKEDTEIIRDSISELANLLSGKIISILNELGTHVKITPPTVFSGSNLQISDKAGKCYLIVISTSIGEIRLNFILEDTIAS